MKNFNFYLKHLPWAHQVFTKFSQPPPSHIVDVKTEMNKNEQWVMKHCSLYASRKRGNKGQWWAMESSSFTHILLGAKLYFSFCEIPSNFIMLWKLTYLWTFSLHFTILILRTKSLSKFHHIKIFDISSGPTITSSTPHHSSLMQKDMGDSR